jgi:hypothetical protein
VLDQGNEMLTTANEVTDQGRRGADHANEVLTCDTWLLTRASAGQVRMRRLRSVLDQARAR